MKVSVRVRDVVTLVRRFEESPAETMPEVVSQMRAALENTLGRVMEAELEIFLGLSPEALNKRNGYTKRRFALKGFGAIEVRVSRDRARKFASSVIPAQRRYDKALEQDIALPNMAGLSKRMISVVSARVLGITVSAKEVSNALETIVPAAMLFMRRDLRERNFLYLYIDGTHFADRRTTVEREPTLVVIGVAFEGRKSVWPQFLGIRSKGRHGRWCFQTSKSVAWMHRQSSLASWMVCPDLQRRFARHLCTRKWRDAGCTKHAMRSPWQNPPTHLSPTHPTQRPRRTGNRYSIRCHAYTQVPRHAKR